MARETVDRYALATRIHALLRPELEAEGWDLVDVRIFRGGGRLQVRLSVDLLGDQRINLDGCARASRAASMFLEEADFFEDAWVLEVSSPGIRRPLRTLDHFAAVLGEDVELKWRPDGDPTARPANLRGRLVAADEGILRIELPPRQDAGDMVESEVDEVVEVPLTAVLEANLDHDFDAQAVIRDDRRRRKQDKRDERSARRKKRHRPRKRGNDGDASEPGTDERDGN